MYKLPEYNIIKQRIHEPRKFIQVIMGPRQVGKSFVVKQVLEDIDSPFCFFAADFVPASQHSWIINCWDTARIKEAQTGRDVILVLDEIQKIDNWSEVVKKLWDEDTFHNRKIKVILLGSSRILLKKGLSESLAGRFEEIRMAQWTFSEMNQAFNTSFHQYLFYGGYPAASGLMTDRDRFDSYIESSIIEATINKDILFDSKISKPSLLRKTFELSAAYSGQILSYTKMLGELQDAGNVVTLKNYLNLLNESCMVTGLMKYSVDLARTKGSIPKFQVYDNSLRNIYQPYNLETCEADPAKWGRIVESAVGAYILNQAFKHRIEVFYWREKDHEVDFILRKKGFIVAIEVKSNNTPYTKSLEIFRTKFQPWKTLIVGDSGLPVIDFLNLPLLSLFP